MKGSHQSQEQGAFGQFLQALTAFNRLLQNGGPALGILARPVAHWANMGVPALHKTLDLPGAEGRQHRRLEAVQLPLLALIGVGAAGYQDAAAGEEGGKALHGLFDLAPALVCFGHFVQPIQ